jgi:hypothetical protein
MQKSSLFFILILASISNVFSQGQFKIRNDQYIQIGYTGYKALTFGQSTGSPNNGNFSIEYCAGCSGSGSGGLNFWKPWPTSNSGNYFMYIRDNGNVGIGNIGDALFKLNVNGAVRATGYFTSSDERLKTNIKTIDADSILSKINNIKVYKYNYINTSRVQNDSISVNVLKPNDPYSFDNNNHHGVIAQEIENIFPDLVATDENGYYNVNYIEFIPLLIQALQEQGKKIAELEKNCCSAIKY